MPSREPLPNLTSIRFLAALYVFLYHFRGFFWARLGFTGVNLFFVLSGFILAYNYPVVKDARRFYAMRFARIYPLYSIALLFAAPLFLPKVWAASRLEVFLGVPLTFALLQTWWPTYLHFLIPAGWTLPVEAFFYLCFPVVLPGVRAGRKHWKEWSVAVAIVVLLPACLLFLRYSAVPLQIPFIYKELLAWPIFHLGEFVVGMFFGLRFLECQHSFHGGHVFATTTLCILATIGAAQIPPHQVEIVTAGLLDLPYALLLYTLAGWRSRWFGHPLLQLGGEISFGIYLLQQPVRDYLRLVSVHFHLHLHWAALLMVVCMLSFLSYTFLEKPARRWILGKFGYASHPKPIETPGLRV